MNGACELQGEQFKFLFFKSYLYYDVNNGIFKLGHQQTFLGGHQVGSPRFRLDQLDHFKDLPRLFVPGIVLFNFSIQSFIKQITRLLNSHEVRRENPGERIPATPVTRRDQFPRLVTYLNYKIVGHKIQGGLFSIHCRRPKGCAIFLKVNTHFHFKNL